MKQGHGFAAAAGLALVFLGAGGAAAQSAGSGRQLVKLAAGEEATVAGRSYHADTPVVAIVSLSSEFATVAVVNGSLRRDRLSARAGDALVTPLDGGRTQQLRFDAQRLAATLPPEWLGDTKASLDAIAARQKRQRFWGLIERTNVNASAPTRAEAVRASYLGNGTIAALRQSAKGNPQLLASLTAKRFAAALAAHDAATVADLIDPKPFTDTGAEASAWQSARGAFAAKLVADDALTGAMASEPASVANDQTAFVAGGFRIRLIPRDRAMFVTSVEAL